MNELINITGIVIAKHQCNDFDEVLEIITSEGKKTIFAPGIRKIESKNRNALNLLDYSSFEIFTSNQNIKLLPRLKKASLIKQFLVDINLINFKNELLLFLNKLKLSKANNFLIAYEIAKIYNIEDKIIQKGLDNMEWIARFEFFSKNPPVILDAAHNEDSIKTLLENLNELYKKDEVIFITSVLETKDFKKIFEKLETITNKIFITSLSGVAYGLDSEEIKSRMIKENIPIHNITFENDIKIAYNKTLELVNQKNTSYKAIVICGSFYEIAKFKNLIG